MSMLEHALAYARLGVHVLPLWWIGDDGLCACGNPDCHSPGKHPIAKLVPAGHLDATTDEDFITYCWTLYPRANIGISLEASCLCAVDSDPRNGGDVTMEKLEAEHGPIASDWHQRTGGGGDHWVFACPQGLNFPGKLGPGVDFKHKGYIAADPSRTTGAYEWLDGGPFAGDWPSPCPDWVLALASAPRHAKAPTIASDALGFEWMGEEGRAELASAMEACPNWERDDWLRMGMVLHMIDPDMDGLGFELWEWWSCLDEGEKKFDPKDQVHIWGSFSRKKDVSLHRESIFWWARKNGWRSCSDKRAEAAAAQIIDRVQNGTVIETQDAPVGAGYGRCPVPLIEETAAHISSLGGYHHPDASLAATLALVGTVASRRYIGTDGTPPHLYIALTADSVNEVRYTLAGVESVLSDAGLRRMVRTTRFGGPGPVYKTLFRSPASIYLTSEWETLLRFARRQPSGTTEQVLNILAELYTRRQLQIDGADEFGLKHLASDEQPVIRHPSLSMLAAMSMEGWELIGKSSEIGRGATESLFAVYCHPDGAIDARPRVEPAPAWLVEHIRTVRGMGAKEPNESDSPLAEIFMDSAETHPRLALASFDADPAQYDGRLADLTDRRALRPLVHGARMTFRRLAVALAAWADPAHPVVTREIMAWCSAFVAHHAARAIERIGILDNEGTVDVGQKVLTKLVDAGKFGMTLREIVHAVRPFKTLSTDEKEKLLDRMVLDGDIVEGDPEGKRRGKRYVAAKYAKAPTEVKS